MSQWNPNRAVMYRYIIVINTPRRHVCTVWTFVCGFLLVSIICRFMALFLLIWAINVVNCHFHKKWCCSESTCHPYTIHIQWLTLHIMGLSVFQWCKNHLVWFSENRTIKIKCTICVKCIFAFITNIVITGKCCQHSLIGKFFLDESP